jgi:hypothetical protein
VSTSEVPSVLCHQLDDPQARVWYYFAFPTCWLSASLLEGYADESVDLWGEAIEERYAMVVGGMTPK